MAAVLMLILLAGLTAPVVWGAVVLGVADHYFTRREAGSRLGPYEAAAWAVPMGAALLAGPICAGLPPPPPAWGAFGSWAFGAAILAAVQGLTTLAAWLALRTGTAPLRAAVVAAAAAAVWLGGLAVGAVGLLAAVVFAGGS